MMRNQILYTIEQWVFNAILVGYWVILYLQSTRSSVEKFSLLYFLIIIPTFIFLGCNLRNIVKVNYTKPSTYLLIFLIIVIPVSLIRLDISTAYNVSLISLTLIAIYNSNVKISSRLVISLFYLSILGGALTHYIGINHYNILPDLSKVGTGNITNINWRVSLFPDAPISAFFALLTFFINYYYRKPSVLKKATSILSLYFIVFGGSRTCILILIFWICFLAVNKFLSIQRVSFYRLYSVLMIIGFIIIVNLPTVIFYISSHFEGDFVNELLFRSKGQVKSIEKLEQENTRQIIWESHLEIYSKSPLIGVGTYYFYDYFPNFEMAGRSKSLNLSESFITDWLVRIGLMLIPFLLFLESLQLRVIRDKNKAQYSIFMTLLITLLAYGSFLVPYNFMFYLFFGSLKKID